VHNAADTSVTWAIGGPALFNEGHQAIPTAYGGVINPDGSWTTPFALGIYSISARSNADPNQVAESHVALFELDNDGDGEQDACDMGAISFSWFLSNGLTYNVSTMHAPWVDDEDVFFFGDAMRGAWSAP
jgi:hypothetical protein